MTKCKASDAAAVLIFAVLLLAAGVFVLAGIAQLAATQSLAGRREWDVLSQRVTLENSRAMARQFVLARMFSNVVSTATNGFTNTVWGGFSISPRVDQRLACIGRRLLFPVQTAALKLTRSTPWKGVSAIPRRFELPLVTAQTK